MSKIFFTSDNHYGHKNIIKYENRPFKDVDDMDNKMIEKWNAKVSKNDTVYILGDFSFGNHDHYLSKLNGHKILVKGNHDSRKINVHNSLFDDVFNYLEINLDNDTFVTMSHYPMLVWNKSHHGSINLFGHVHSLLHNIKYDEIMRCPSDNSYNVGVDVNNFEPCTLEEIIANNEIWRKKLW